MNYSATLELVETKKEANKDSQIILKVYAAPQGFVYSIDVKLGRFIRSHYPNPTDEKFCDISAAKRAAIRRIRALAKSAPNAKKHLAALRHIQMEGQLELFDF